MIHSMPLDGDQGHFKLDVGATLTVPNEIRLSLSDLRERKSALDSVHVSVDIDRIDLCAEY